MRSIICLLRGAKRRVAIDLRTDPYLRYIFVVATVLLCFWFWHLIPSFATQDEHARLLDVLPAIGALVSDPGVGSLQAGVIQGRMYGATYYLNALAVLPAVVFAALTGQLDLFVPFYQPTLDVWATDADLWLLWHSTPRWVWSSSLFILRLFSVGFALGCVYLVYWIGTHLRDRSTGRLAALFLSITFGFVVTAHEAGEDIPVVFLLLLVLALALRYIDTGDRRCFLVGCAAGGLAIAFKLTGVITIVVLGTAYLQRARATGGDDWIRTLVRPRFIVLGTTIGLVAIVLGYPSVLLSGPDALFDRVLRGTTNKSAWGGGRDVSRWWWFLRGYLNGFGLLLFLGTVGGVTAVLAQLRHQSDDTDGLMLVLVTIAICVGFLSWWKYVRVHHLLPTMPLLVILLAVALGRAVDRRPTIGRAVAAVLIVSSVLYTGYGVAGYATQPRAAAADWLETNAPDDATVEVYKDSPHTAAVPHGMLTNHYGHRNAEGEIVRTETTYAGWMTSMPERCPEYVQLTREDLLRLAPPDLNGRARFYADHHLETAYIRELLTNESDSYEIAVEFGSRPWFIDRSRTEPRLPELLRVGIVPRTVQYGDEQDLGPKQYTLILERTRPCG